MTVELRNGLAQAFNRIYDDESLNRRDLLRNGTQKRKNADGVCGNPDDEGFTGDLCWLPYFTLTSVNDTSVGRLPSVFLKCSGKVIAGSSRGLRSLINVVVIHSSMDTREPWDDVQPHLDAALRIIYTVRDAFPEVLPINTAVINPQKNKEKLFSASIIQVLSS